MVIIFESFYNLYLILAEMRLSRMCETEHLQEKFRELLLELIRGENLTQYTIFMRARALLGLMQRIQERTQQTRDRKNEVLFHQGTPRKVPKGK